jgi:hypothetical protein
MALTGNKKRLKDEKEKAYDEAEDVYKKTHSEMSKKTRLGWTPNETPPNRHISASPFSKESAEEDNKKSKTIGEWAHKAGSKHLADSGVFDMEDDMKKHEEEQSKKNNLRFSALKKLLRGE